MATYNNENILVGAAAILLGAPDAELPAYAEGMAASIAAEPGWTSAGYTTGGVEVTYTPDFGEVEVDQLLDAAVMFKQRMTVTVGTTLAEATLENLVFAWGQAGHEAADPLDNTITGGEYVDGGPQVQRSLEIESGSLGDRPLERQLAFVGQAPVGWEERVYHLNRCLNVESSAFSLSRADATTIPVSLRCLPNDNGQYGTITDVVATTP